MFEFKKSSFILALIVVFLIALSFLIYNTLQSNSVLNEEIESLETEVEYVNNTINDISSQITVRNDEVTFFQDRLNENLSDLKYLRNGSRYTLHDPTYSELVDFLQSDDTDTNEDIGGDYGIINFANEVNNNSEKNGIRCSFVYVNFSGYDPYSLVGYLVGFNTTDKGMIYYDASLFSVHSNYAVGLETESGSYWKINLEIGKDYYSECAVIPSNMYYPYDEDFIIQDIVHYW